jgi:hypothetical protein
MSEFDELIARLLEQRETLLAIIREAGAKVNVFLKAIDLARSELAKIESVLNAMKAGQN